MGSLSVSPPDELIKALNKMGDMDKIAPRMVEAGLEPLEKAIRRNVSRYRRTGQLADGVSHSKPKINKKDYWQGNVVFKGTDKKTGVRNAEKAFILEYGKQGQEERPSVRPAIVETEKKSLEAMQGIFESESQLRNIQM